MAVVATPTGPVKLDTGDTVHLQCSGGGASYQWKFSIDSGSTYNNCTGTGNNTNDFEWTVITGVTNIKCTTTNGDSNVIAATNYSALACTIAVGSTDIVVGETVHCVATPSGGYAAGYTYQWYDNEISLGGSYQTVAIDYAPSTVGTHNLECKVDDATDGDTHAVESADTAVSVHSFYTMMAGSAGYLAKIAKAVGQ